MISRFCCVAGVCGGLQALLANTECYILLDCSFDNYDINIQSIPMRRATEDELMSSGSSSVTTSTSTSVEESDISSYNDDDLSVLSLADLLPPRRP